MSVNALMCLGRGRLTGPIFNGEMVYVGKMGIVGQEDCAADQS